MAVASRIQLIYDNSQAALAEQITMGLTKDGRATLLDDAFGNMSFESAIEIAGDAAIVLMSKEATDSPAWQEVVRSVGNDVRMIPVVDKEDVKENVDVNNPDIVPESLSEINFIPIDGHLMDNILDSLTTDPDFYRTKNDLLSLATNWELSGCNEFFLITSVRRAYRDRKLVRKKFRYERDEHLLSQLGLIYEFSTESLKHSTKILLGTVWRNAKNGILIIFAALIVAAAMFGLPYLRRAANASLLLGADINILFPDVAAVRSVEGLLNPFVPESARLDFHRNLRVSLDLNWPHSTIGFLYRWNINGSNMTMDTRYIWTADSGGRVARWDRETGKMVEFEQVSALALTDVAVTECGTFFATLDSEGYVYAKTLGDGWRSSELSTGAPFTTDTAIRISNDGRAKLVISHNSISVLSNDGHIVLEKQFSFDGVLDAQMGDSVFLAAVVDGEQLKYIEFDMSGILNHYVIPSTLHATRSAAIWGDKLLFADENGQIVIWDKASPDSIRPAGITLSVPLYLAFLDDSNIVYHDRNTGTRIYNIEHRIDLGGVLTGTPGVARLNAFEGQVYLHANSRVHSQDVRNMLPRNSIEGVETLVVFCGQTHERAGGQIRDVAIINEYLVVASLVSGDFSTSVVFDGANRLFGSSTQRDETLLEGIPANPLFYNSPEVSFVGKPTVVGILDDGRSIAIGAHDGSFFEVNFLDDGQSALVASRRQVPSRSPIVAIHQTYEHYYLEDADGLFWISRIGYRVAASYSDLAQAVRDKLRSAFDDEMFSIVSPQVASLLDLQRLPGADGKVWD